MPSTSSRPLTALLALLLPLASCFESPLERDNILDPGAGARIAILPGTPDTLYTSLESFVAEAELNRSVPEVVVGLRWEVSENVSVLGHAGGGYFYAQPSAGLAPVTAKFIVYVHDRDLSPIAESSVVVRKRVADADFVCQQPASNCPVMQGPDEIGVLTMVLRDAAGFTIPLVNSPVRFGTVDSTDPSVVEVLDRPTQAAVRIRAVAPGGAWVRLIGELTRDSLYVTVSP